MGLVDKEHFFHENEVRAYIAMLEGYKLSPEDFDIRVTEDQDEIDMGDLNYVVMLYVKVTHLPSKQSKTYSCAQNSHLWIKEMVEDIENGLFG